MSSGHKERKEGLPEPILPTKRSEALNKQSKGDSKKLREESETDVEQNIQFSPSSYEFLHIRK